MPLGLIGGLGLRIAGALLPLTLFSGEAETGELIRRASAFGAPALIVLALVQHETSSVSVDFEAPQLTATVGVHLMLATFATLILLVQHISTMLPAPNIAAAAGAELLEAVSAEILEEVTSADDQRPPSQSVLDTLSDLKRQSTSKRAPNPE